MIDEAAEDALAAQLRDLEAATHGCLGDSSRCRPPEYMVPPELEEATTELRAELEKHDAADRFEAFKSERLGWWGGRAFLVFQRPGVDASLFDPSLNNPALPPAARYKAAPWRGGQLRPLFAAMPVVTALDLLLDNDRNPEALLERLRRLKLAHEREHKADNAAAFEAQRQRLRDTEEHRARAKWAARPSVARAMLRLAATDQRHADLLRAIADAIETEAGYDRAYAERIMRPDGHKYLPPALEEPNT